MQSSSSAPELSWYTTLEEERGSVDWHARIQILDEPSSKDCDPDDYVCNSFCTHSEYSDNSYYPCPCNSVDGGYGNNEGVPDNSVLGYKTVNKTRFYTTTVVFSEWGSSGSFTSQPGDDIDINLWYNTGNGSSLYSPLFPHINASLVYDYYYYNSYENYEYDSYNSYENYDYYESATENFSEDENSLIYGEIFGHYWMFFSCMASKEDGSQSWIFFEKTLIVSYFSRTPMGFCECLQDENDGQDYATTETIKNCYGMSVSEVAARNIVSPVAPPMRPVGPPVRPPTRKQKPHQRMQPNKEGNFYNDNKKPTETKAH